MSGRFLLSKFLRVLFRFPFQARFYMARIPEFPGIIRYAVKDTEFHSFVFQAFFDEFDQVSVREKSSLFSNIENNFHIQIWDYRSSFLIFYLFSRDWQLKQRPVNSNKWPSIAKPVSWESLSANSFKSQSAKSTTVPQPEQTRWWWWWEGRLIR